MKKTILFIWLTSMLANNIHCMKRKLITTTEEEQQTKKFKLEEKEGPFSSLALYFLPKIFVSVNQHTKKQLSYEGSFLCWENMTFYHNCSEANVILNALCQQTNNLSFVNKTWNKCINHPYVIRAVVNTILNNFDDNYTNHGTIAKKISSRGTKNYTLLSSLLYHEAAKGSPLLGHSIKELICEGADINFEHSDHPLPRWSTEQYIREKQKLEHMFKPLPTEDAEYFLSREEYTCLQQLLDLEAGLNVIDNEKTALAVALQNKNDTIAKILLEFHPAKKCLQTALKYLPDLQDLIEKEIADAATHTITLNYDVSSNKKIALAFAIQSSIEKEIADNAARAKTLNNDISCATHNKSNLNFFLLPVECLLKLFITINHNDTEAALSLDSLCNQINTWSLIKSLSLN